MRTFDKIADVFSFNTASFHQCSKCSLKIVLGTSGIQRVSLCALWTATEPGQKNPLITSK